MQFNKQLISSLIVGTKSRTRRKVLEKNNIHLKYRTANIDEKKIIKGESVSLNQQSLYIATAKAKYLSMVYPNNNILCFDTTIHFGNKTIFKCTSEKECLSLLKRLNNKTHILNTSGVIMKKGKLMWKDTEKCKITLKNNSDYDLKKYINVNFKEIVNSVGCYNIESTGMEIIDKMEGSFYGVLGIPFSILRKLAGVR